MHDLSAVAGVTGDGLKQIETFARQSAKAFGTDAAVAVEGYKLLLSQLSPELGKYPDHGDEPVRREPGGPYGGERGDGADDERDGGGGSGRIGGASGN